MLSRSPQNLCVRFRIESGCLPRRLQLSLRNSSCAVFVTVLPMLHVASTSFYDFALATIAESAQLPRRIVIEGVLRDEEEQHSRESEWRQMGRDAALRESIDQLARRNALYKDSTLHSICQELHLPLDMDIFGPSPRLRLQAAYFLPLLAAKYASSLVTGDICLTETGDAVSSLLVFGSPEIGHFGRHPEVKAVREAHCASVARQCAISLLANEPSPGGSACLGETVCRGHVFVPWGMYHTDGIVAQLLSSGSDHNTVCFEDPPLQISPISFGLTEADIAALASR